MSFWIVHLGWMVSVVQKKVVKTQNTLHYFCKTTIYLLSKYTFFNFFVSIQAIYSIKIPDLSSFRRTDQSETQNDTFIIDSDYVGNSTISKINDLSSIVSSENLVEPESTNSFYTI